MRFATIFQTRKLQQLFHQDAHTFGLPPHLLNRLLPYAVEHRVVRQCIQIPGNHRQRRTQFVRRIGNEIFAHRFEAHLTTDVTHDQQALRRAFGLHQVKRQPALEFTALQDRHRLGVIAPLQVLHKDGMTHKILDPNADVALASQPQPTFRSLIEPQQLVVFAEQDGAIGHACSETAEFPQQAYDTLFMKLFTAINSRDDRNDFAPRPAHVGWCQHTAKPHPAI